MSEKTVKDPLPDRISMEFTAVPFYQDFFLIRWHLYRDLRNISSSIMGGRWLDVGCGIKPYAGLFENVDFYVGLDHPDAMKGHYGLDTRVDVWGDAVNIPFRSNSFDGALSIHLIEHLTNPREHLEGIYRVLKSGGQLILSAPFVWPLHGEPDFSRFTSMGLAHLAESVGFRVDKIKAQGGAWSAAGQMIITCLLFGALRPKARWGRVLGWFWKVTLVPLINGVALVLDRFFSENRWSLSYLVVATKR